MSDFRWPTTQQRVSVVGRTGTGKTVFGAWVLANCAFNKIPYVIFDYKGDDLLNSIKRSRRWNVRDGIPREPGIYVMKLVPERDDVAVESWLWKAHKRENVGLFFDEGYMIPKCDALNALYTQGRSKHIPIITLSQRPVNLGPFVISESDFFFGFALNNINDRKRLREQIPNNAIWDFNRQIPEYHCRWYDVARDKSLLLAPCPDPEYILDKFDERLKPSRHFY